MLRKMDVFGLEKTGGYPPAFHYLKGGYRGERHRIFSELHNDRKRGNSNRL